MKQIKIILAIFILSALLPLSVFSQVNSSLSRETVLEVYPLEVTLNKTISIRFPEDIISADVGSIGILASKFERVENILRVKANTADFEDASLTVVTGDSKIYTFVVSYTNNPKYLTLDMNQTKPLNQTGRVMKNAQASRVPMPVDGEGGQVALQDSVSASFIKFEETQLNVATIKALSEKSKVHKKTIRHLGVESNDMLFAATGIFVKENVMFLQLRVENRSHINYDIDLIQLIVRDKKVGKKTSQQEISIEPILRTDNTEDLIVRGKSSLVFTYAIRKLTIPDNKELVVQLYEEDGGRNAEFVIDNSDLLKAKLIEN